MYFESTMKRIHTFSVSIWKFIFFWRKLSMKCQDSGRNDLRTNMNVAKALWSYTYWRWIFYNCNCQSEITLEQLRNASDNHFQFLQPLLRFSLKVITNPSFESPHTIKLPILEHKTLILEYTKNSLDLLNWS